MPNINLGGFIPILKLKCNYRLLENGAKVQYNIIQSSNLFEYSREICFENVEQYDQERFKKFLISQSSMQHAIKYNYDKIIDELNILDEKLNKVFNGQKLNAIFSYRMRIGIK